MKNRHVIDHRILGIIGVIALAGTLLLSFIMGCSKEENQLSKEENQLFKMPKICTFKQTSRGQ